MHVLIIIKKDILDRVIINNQTNLISYFYCLYLDIKKFDSKTKKNPRKTRIVNLYDNKIGQKRL